MNKLDPCNYAHGKNKGSKFADTLESCDLRKADFERELRSDVV